MTGGPGSPCLQHRGCSTPSGLMLHRVDLSRGLHPGLFCSTPSGLMLHRVRLSRGFHPGLFVPPLRGGFPVTPSRGLHAGLFCSTPPGWFSGHSHPGFSPRAFLFHPSGVAFRSLPPGVCTPGFSVPPLSGVAFRSLPTGGLHPGLFCSTPPGWLSGHSHPGVCTPGFSVPPLSGVASRSLPRRCGRDHAGKP